MNSSVRKLDQWEQLNFLLTNRLPRHALTRFMGWFSRIENRWLARVSIALWQRFADDLRLDEAEQQQFNSLRACFIRRLRPGARPVDTRPNILVSPCDAVIGECGEIRGRTVFQAKGYPYELDELIPDPQIQQKYQDGVYVTLRLKSSMYHRFHAPVDCTIQQIEYVSGDTWNVNPPALKRIEKLYCRNERAVVPLVDTATAGSVCLVPVAAILVASMQFHGLDEPLDLSYAGPNRIAISEQYSKGDEIGYFQHGSTIVLFATKNFELLPGREPGVVIRMGEPLLSDSSTTPDAL